MHLLETTARPRSYLALPPPTAGPWPVVVMLHGAGGTADWTLRETRWQEVSEREGFLLVVPNATRREPGRPASFLDNPQVWNDGATDSEPARPAVDDVAFLAAVLDDVAFRYPVDAKRVYVTGFSNGAAMTFRFAASHGHRMAAIAPVAGYCHVTTAVLPVPTLFLVGAVDPLVPIDGGEVTTPWGRRKVMRPPLAESLARWAAAIGCATSAGVVSSADGVTVTRYDGPVPFYAGTIADLGHHWPGGRGELLRRIAGPPADRIDGRAVIWDFFRTHGTQPEANPGGGEGSPPRPQS